MMNPNNPTKYIRELAKTSYYQTLFNGSKELGFRLFLNDRDFTNIQILFLSFLNFYSILNFDISLGDVKDIVFKNEIYEDSYMYYRNNKSNKEENKTNQKTNIDFTNSQWVFKKKSDDNKSVNRLIGK